MAEVYTFGESMARISSPKIGPLRHATQLSLGVAGAESNLAIGMARLGSSVSWTGRVGDDEFGRLISSTLRGEAVELHAIVDDEAPTGLMFKSRRSSSVSDVVYYRSGSAGSRLAPDDLDHAAIAAADVLHLSGITPALSDSARAACFAAVETARAGGTAVSLDLNMRRRLWDDATAGSVLRELAALSTIVFATVDEGQLIADGADAPGELAASIARLGPSEVLIKHGAEGALGLIDGRLIEVAPHEVDEIDPVGAGDAFAAGYLHERVRGSDAESRLRTAALCGAFAVTVDGDWEGLPSRRELAALSESPDIRR